VRTPYREWKFASAERFCTGRQGALLNQEPLFPAAEMFRRAFHLS